MAKLPYIKEYTNREAFDNVRESPYYQGKMDIWYMFACRALDILKPETGTLAFIATNNWTTNFGAKRLRGKVTKDARIEHLIDFGDFKVFKDAGIQTMAVGLIIHADQAESILQHNQADLVAIGREMLHNPNWVMDAADKLNEERVFDIVAENYGYWLEKRANTGFNKKTSTWQHGIDN